MEDSKMKNKYELSEAEKFFNEKHGKMHPVKFDFDVTEDSQKIEYSPEEMVEFADEYFQYMISDYMRTDPDLALDLIGDLASYVTNHMDRQRLGEKCDEGS